MSAICPQSGFGWILCPVYGTMLQITHKQSPMSYISLFAQPQPFPNQNPFYKLPKKQKRQILQSEKLTSHTKDDHHVSLLFFFCYYNPNTKTDSAVMGAFCCTPCLWVICVLSGACQTPFLTSICVWRECMYDMHVASVFIRWITQSIGAFARWSSFNDVYSIDYRHSATKKISNPVCS